MSTAFLHALILGIDIFAIHSALCGLSNAPRLWQDHFASVMKTDNFKRMKRDPNLHVHGSKKLDVLCNVGALLIFGSDSDFSHQLVQDLGKDLLVKPLVNFLKVRQSLSLVSRKYDHKPYILRDGMSETM